MRTAAPARHRSPEPKVGILPRKKNSSPPVGGGLQHAFFANGCEVGIVSPKSEFRLRSLSKVGFPTSLFCRKTHHRASAEGPGDMLSSQHNSRSVFSTIHTPCRQSWPGNRIASPIPSVATGLFHPILLWQQDCSTQSCCGNRIALPNPAVATGLLSPILRWQQECPGASRAARTNKAIRERRQLLAEVFGVGSEPGSRRKTRSMICVMLRNPTRACRRKSDMLCCEFQAERLTTYSCPASEPGRACPA